MEVELLSRAAQLFEPLWRAVVRVVNDFMGNSISVEYEILAQAYGQKDPKGA